MDLTCLQKDNVDSYRIVGSYLHVNKIFELLVPLTVLNSLKYKLVLNCKYTASDIPQNTHYIETLILKLFKSKASSCIIKDLIFRSLTINGLADPSLIGISKPKSVSINSSTLEKLTANYIILFSSTFSLYHITCYNTTIQDTNMLVQGHMGLQRAIVNNTTIQTKILVVKNSVFKDTIIKAREVKFIFPDDTSCSVEDADTVSFAGFRQSNSILDVNIRNTTTVALYGKLQGSIHFSEVVTLIISINQISDLENLQLFGDVSFVEIRPQQDDNGVILSEEIVKSKFQVLTSLSYDSLCFQYM